MGLAFYLLSCGLILAAPALIIAAVKTRKAPLVGWCALIATISFCWLIVSGMFWHGALGPDGTNLRIVLIGANFGGMLLIAIGSAFVRPISSKWMAWATGILACLWAYAGFINLIPPDVGGN